MKSKIIFNPEINEQRPKNQKQFQTKKINQKIKQEIALAKHNLLIFCINNAWWFIPLISLIIIAIVIDLISVFYFWKNPAILFNQFKIFVSWAISYFLGLFTDEIRRKITKYN